MRTVICHLAGASPEDVSTVLDASFVRQEGGFWLLRDASGDPLLYIGFYQHIQSEFHPIELERLREAVGDEITVSVQADVSGRHDGAEEVRRFAKTLLSKFRGVATDDNGSRPWTLNEIERGANGHAFFSGDRK